MTRHKDQHDAILTRRREDTEAHPLHRTVPEIAGSFRFIRTQGHNNKHARHGIRLCHGTESVVLCTHSPVNDEEPFFDPDPFARKPNWAAPHPTIILPGRVDLRVDRRGFYNHMKIQNYPRANPTRLSCSHTGRHGGRPSPKPKISTFGQCWSSGYNLIRLQRDHIHLL